MKRVFQDLPGWLFDIDEVSNGVYRVTAVDESRRQVSRIGTEPELLIEQCRSEAQGIICSDQVRR